MITHDTLQMKSGILLAVPIPTGDALDKGLMEGIIDEALIDAKKSDIYGKAITPYLLKRLNEKTFGKSLAANIALVQNNAHVGSKIAQAYNVHQNIAILFDRLVYIKNGFFQLPV